MYDVPRQLWKVASGYGKSRIVAAVILLALLKGQFSKVHLLFNDEYLMKRDQEEFKQYWYFVSEGLVVYHCNTDFVVGEGELLLIDEADILIFSQTKKLVALLGVAPCIALTATPDNADEQGIEKAVTNHLQFKCFDYTGNKNIDYEAIIKQIQTLPFKASDEENKRDLIKYIKDLIKVKPVLLFCDSALHALLR